MIYPVSGIVLRTVKYGDTSVVVTMYTDLFGLQAYMVNGVRKSGKNYKAYLYQPGSVLEVEVYHNQLKNLQRIKEARWKKVYHLIFTDVIRNAVNSFLIELLLRSIIAEEKNEDLYLFAEQELFRLDEAPEKGVADIPLKFMLRLPAYLGFGIENNYRDQFPLFSPHDGRFVSNSHEPGTILSSELNNALSMTLKNLNNSQQLPLNGKTRNSLLHLLEEFYQYHVAGFSRLKSLDVLEMILRG